MLTFIIHYNKFRLSRSAIIR